MVVNLSIPRGDIVYLKRRLKPGEQRPVSASVTSSLSLSAPSTPEASKAPTKPPVAGKVVLTLDDNPVVRTNARQAGIGSLIIHNVSQFAWAADGKSGYESVHDIDPNIPVYGNRKLVQFYKGNVILGLRHITHLKRLILEAEDGIIEVELLDGSRITTDSNHGENVVYLSRVKNIIELRIEKKTGSLTDTYSVTRSL